MKNFKFILFSLAICFFGITIVNAGNPYKQSGPYGTNCTWYAWKMANERAGISLPGWGNAKEWYSDAQNSGYSVGTTPSSNSIIVWGDWTSYGHVGYVEKVEGDTLHVWDSTGPCINEEDPTYIECMANGVSEETDKACKAAAPRIACKYSISSSEYNVTGYIYLNDAPKNSSATINTTKKEKKKKSNNANLSEIELSVGAINFDKTVLIYQLEVENEIDVVEVNAKSEDQKANISGLGKYELNIGLNKISLIVTAEDKTTKEYIIEITRKEKSKEKITVSKNIETKEKAEIKEADNKKNILIFSGCLILLLLGLIIFNLNKKKYKKMNR